MKLDIIIREAEPDDAEELLEFFKQIGSETDNMPYGPEGTFFTLEGERRYLENVKNSKTSIIYLSTHNKKIVGIASIETFGAKRMSHRSKMMISILKDYWGNGIGSMLISNIIKFAKSIKLEIITLDVRSDNAPAIGLYEKFNFEKTGTSKKYFKINGEYFDAYNMELHIV